jgi:hypothetical protein
VSPSKQANDNVALVNELLNLVGDLPRMWLVGSKNIHMFSAKLLNLLFYPLGELKIAESGRLASASRRNRETKRFESGTLKTSLSKIQNEQK